MIVGQTHGGETSATTIYQVSKFLIGNSIFVCQGKFTSYLQVIYQVAPIFAEEIV